MPAWSGGDASHALGTDSLGRDILSRLIYSARPALIVAFIAALCAGILGTALALGVLAAIGFLIAGVPGATLLGLATFFFSVVPVGPPLIWGSAALWLFYQGSTGMAIFMGLWGLLVISLVDNFLKPIIISRGSHLPFILVFLGVLGGVLAFGFIGVFLGPTLLAVGYQVLTEWMRRAKSNAS